MSETMLEEAAPAMPEPTPAPALPGAELRAAREARGLSLEEVSQALKFGVRQIDALESDDYSGLKGSTFVRGFVRSYARYLRLDEAPLLAGLETVVPAPAAEVRPVESMNAEMPVSAGDGSKRAYWLSLGVLLLGALAWFAWQGRPSAPDRKPTANAPASAATAPAPTALPAPGAPAASANAAGAAGNAPPAPTAAAAAPVDAGAPAVADPAAATPAVAAAGATAAPNPNDRQLAFDFSAVAWVEVRDVNDRVLYSGNSTPGTRQVVRGRPPFQIVVGNAQTVKLRYEDRAIDLQPYTRVDVARLTLDDNTK